jgi:isoleucyl-tRNA synthetase
MPESVHLCDYPTPDDCRDEYLEEQMALTMTAVSQGRYLRTQHNLKVRQPLAKAVLAAGDDRIRKMLEETSWIIAEELNVKSVEFTNDEAELVKRSCKANFKALGSRLGKNMKAAAAIIEQFSSSVIGDILAGKPYAIEVEGNQVEISANDLVIKREEKPGMVAASESGVTIALATELTAELEAEGLARELVSKLQNLRKESNFEVTDRIKVTYKSSAEAASQLEMFADYIKNEVLADEFSAGEADTELDVNGVAIAVKVTRI